MDSCIFLERKKSTKSFDSRFPFETLTNTPLFCYWCDFVLHCDPCQRSISFPSRCTGSCYPLPNRSLADALLRQVLRPSSRKLSLSHRKRSRSLIVRLGMVLRTTILYPWPFNEDPVGVVTPSSPEEQL